ncbi:MAG: hypothetical protein ACFFE8_17080 [Candidatus Heimdallarchaeota archaeon]
MGPEFIEVIIVGTAPWKERASGTAIGVLTHTRLSINDRTSLI